MKRLAYVALLGLAACPAKKTGGGTGPSTPTAGCPAAKDVYVASYVAQEPGKGRSGWVMPLHTKPAGDPSQVPEYATLSAEAASAAGIPVAPQGALWLVTPNAAPCPVKLASYYEARIDGPPASATYGIEVNGCAAPANLDEAGGFVLASEQSPAGCHFEQPQPVAARIGDMDKQKQWQRPTKETPIPAPVAALVPPHDCTAPDCEALWAFSEVKVNNATVAWTGAINWLAIGKPDEQCKWTAERYSGFFVPSGTGAVKISEGQGDHSLALLAALVDNTGAKVLLAEGPGEYATYDVSAGGAPLGHHIAWMVAPADAWDAVDFLGPICEPKQP